METDELWFEYAKTISNVFSLTRNTNRLNGREDLTGSSGGSGTRRTRQTTRSQYDSDLDPVII